MLSGKRQSKLKLSRNGNECKPLVLGPDSTQASAIEAVDLKRMVWLVGCCLPRHVIRCRLTQDARVQLRVDDVSGNICQALAHGAGELGRVPRDDLRIRAGAYSRPLSAQPSRF